MDYENMQEENEVMQLAEEAAVDENWLRDFKTGIAMGLCLSSQFESKAEPIAYFYGHVAKEGETPTRIINGVGYVGADLPALPECKYPYVMVCYTASTNVYWISVSEGRPYYTNAVSQSSERTIGVGLCGYRQSWIVDAESNSFVLNYESGGPGGLSTFLSADKIQVIWSNCDIIDDNGDVYMAAGYTNYPDAPPVPAETVAADPCPDKSVMYLYDNAATDEVGDTVMLPAIPEIDRRVYPYFALCSQGKRSTFGSDPEWMAVASRYPLNEYVNNDRYRHHVYCFIDETDSTKWGQWVKDEGYYGPLEGCNVDAWANHDVYDYDGNRVISASDPIPVYE